MAVQQTVGQRFSQLIQALGMSKNAFALSLDKTATVIQHIVEERNKPGFDLLCKVFEVYPNVSKDWLMQGAGSMFPFAEATTDIPAPATIAEVSAPTTPAPALMPQPETAAAAPAETPATPAAAGPSPGVNVVASADPVPAPVVPPVPPAAPALPAPSWEAMLYAQQLQHQLALAEQRNQHLVEQQKMLLEQQRMMQQMVEMLRPVR
ncbi:hypothetical protein LJ737_16870 [Hymenobacter sp. 15J16-1T3B]|uniref:hypothetical protein n=1 Tax=Hymenobacter sp. 15J16-1T3B TaxID=2886941 RepID=UPI001D105451|nr:hypothetical protein [Hymenobacter sp. 15J16-1T3B]MCC3158918.1 hypothetical protein [Hymenobacter sp. 15J16-1T3B]